MYYLNNCSIFPQFLLTFAKDRLALAMDLWSQLLKMFIGESYFEIFEKRIEKLKTITARQLYFWTNDTLTCKN